MWRRLAFTFTAALLACGSLKAAEDVPAPDGEDDAATDGAVTTAETASDASDPAKPDAPCTPSCTARKCGPDPVCGTPCGMCSAAEVCEQSDASSACKAPTIVWEVDGTRVAAFATAEALHYASDGSYQLFFPYWGRNVQIFVPAGATAGPLTSCPSNAVSVSLTTSDNSWAGLGTLPARWKNLTFVSCGATTDGDVVTARDVSLTQVSPARIAGSYEIVVQGKGAREGSTLRVRGVFDVAPTVQ